MRTLGCIARLLALLLIGWAAKAEPEPITIVYGDSYKPFAWGSGLDARGIQRDFVQRVLVERMGLRVVHEVLPWRRAQNYVRDGERDGFFTVPTEERAQYTSATAASFYETHFVMHTAKRNPQVMALRRVRTLQDLEGLPELRHIHMLGSGWHETALKFMPNVTQAVDAARIPSMLVRMRADLYIEQLEMFRFQAQEVGLLEEIVSFPDLPLRKVGWHLFFGKKSKHLHLLPRIDDELRQMQASGELQRLKVELFQRHGIR
jgi:polar amino acid transport system substrate-binding protein